MQKEVIDILEIFRILFFFLFKKKFTGISNLGRKSQFLGFNHFSSAAGSLKKIWREEEWSLLVVFPARCPDPRSNSRVQLTAFSPASAKTMNLE